jgi:hypothetical protein
MTSPPAPSIEPLYQTCKRCVRSNLRAGPRLRPHKCPHGQWCRGKTGRRRQQRCAQCFHARQLVLFPPVTTG